MEGRYLMADVDAGRLAEVLANYETRIERLEHDAFELKQRGDALELKLYELGREAHSQDDHAGATATLETSTVRFVSGNIRLPEDGEYRFGARVTGERFQAVEFIITPEEVEMLTRLPWYQGLLARRIDESKPIEVTIRTVLE